MPTRSLPWGSVSVPSSVAISFSGRVMPCIVKSPSISKSSSSIGRTDVDWKVIFGVCSASKKSAERRCPSRWGSRVSTLAVFDAAVGADAVGRDLERALELLELALDRRDAEVFDLEFDARVDGVDVPRAGGQGGLRDG